MTPLVHTQGRKDNGADWPTYNRDLGRFAVFAAQPDRY
jgi:hypothetical protein